jgi:hypothetical protein
MSSDNEEEKIPTKPTRRVNQHATPKRKASAQKRTPASAPVRKTTGRKGEPPSLFQDFLLGRPSPARTGRGVARRNSLDGVKREMKLGIEEVSKVPPPGGVKDRVKQWQKSNAKAGVPDSTAPEVEEDDEEKEVIHDSHTRPGRRKSKEAEDVTRKVTVAKQRSKSAAAPKKRVISDDHWMKKAQSPTPKKSPMEKKGSPIPKDFLTNYKTAQNPPLNKKIQDWVKRNASEEAEENEKSPEDAPRRSKTPRRNNGDETPTRRQTSSRDEMADTPARKDDRETPRRRMPSRAALLSDDGIRVRASESPDDGIRVRPSPEPTNDGIRVRPSRDNSFNRGDDGIRIKPSPEPEGDSIRIKPSRDKSSSYGDGDIRVKPTRRERRPQEEDSSEVRTPRKRSERHLNPPDHESYGGDSQHDSEETSSWVTPSRTETRQRRRKSGSPSESSSEIPFGNSAFSVLDLPVGAEANTMRRPMPKPKRNPSFIVPKVLKKVYNVGKEIVHDTVEPPRVVGSNQQPPNIESWLSGTSDPFVDRPASAPGSMLGVPESISRRRSYKEDDEDEQELMSEADLRRSKRNSRVQGSHEFDNRPEVTGETTPKSRETLPSMGNSPPSPSGLRRSPATRNITSPKSARKLPLKEALLDAFRGESISWGPKGNPLAEITGVSERISPPPFSRNDQHTPDEASSPRAPRRKSPKVQPPEEEIPRPSFPRRMAPTTGQHRLSTIASVETFSTSSSGTGTESDLSQTTVTQSTRSTIYTAPTASTLSHNNNKSGLKRRLTKHSDLISVLSLPDTVAPGRATSIRSARSIRTNRTRLETATLKDLMQELATDEMKYLRELKTLVDGVIPVLLTCVLSKSDSAIAAGLFSPHSNNEADSSFMKPIVDMGVALERLKSLHNRIPLEDPVALVSWLNSAHKTYDDYFTAWRMGFQDVVVNLAPASPSEESITQDDMPRNAHGDVIKEDGERVDVAHLLKAPLVRSKYLSKVAKVNYIVYFYITNRTNWI